MTAAYLCNPELDCLKLIIIFSKLCLQSGCNLADIGSLVLEKFDDHSLIMVHPKRTFNGFEDPDREDHFLRSHSRIQFDLFNFPKGPDCRDTLT
jgi:hypothetical protein